MENSSAVCMESDKVKRYAYNRRASKLKYVFPALLAPFFCFAFVKYKKRFLIPAILFLVVGVAIAALFISLGLLDPLRIIMSGEMISEEALAMRMMLYMALMKFYESILWIPLAAAAYLPSLIVLCVMAGKQDKTVACVISETYDCDGKAKKKELSENLCLLSKAGDSVGFNAALNTAHERYIARKDKARKKRRKSIAKQ